MKREYKQTVQKLENFFGWMLHCIGSLVAMNLSCLGFAHSAPIGFGYSTAALTSRNQEAIFTGFKLGLSGFATTDKVNDLIRVRSDTSGSQLAALDVAQQLLADNVSIIVGFSGSHDSLLVGKLMKRREILTIFPGSNHNSIRDFGPYVYSTGHSMDDEVRSILDFTKSKFNQKRGLLILNPYAVASASQEPIFDRVQSEFNGINLKKAKLGRDLTLDERTLVELKSGSYAYIVITFYPEAFLKLERQLRENHIDLPMAAGSSWGLGDADLMRRFLVERTSPFYISSEWIKGSPESKEFEQKFKRAYGKEPTPENALGYDLGQIVAALLRDTRGAPTRKSVVEAFHKRPCFEGLSVGKLCFGVAGGHSTVKPRFFRFTLDASQVAKRGL